LRIPSQTHALVAQQLFQDARFQCPTGELDGASSKTVLLSATSDAENGMVALGT
jgi:hypothetical protein